MPELVIQHDPVYWVLIDTLGDDPKAWADKMARERFPLEGREPTSSGARIRDVIEEQLPELAGLRRPNLITVDVSGNDLRRYDAATYREDVAALVAGLPKGLCRAAWSSRRCRRRCAPGAGRACSPTTQRTGSTRTTVVTGSGRLLLAGHCPARRSGELTGDGGFPPRGSAASPFGLVIHLDTGRFGEQTHLLVSAI